MIRFLDEKHSESFPNHVVMREFNECIKDYDMCEVYTSGARYTRCNGQDDRPRILQALDQVLQSVLALQQRCESNDSSSGVFRSHPNFVFLGARCL